MDEGPALQPDRREHPAWVRRWARTRRCGPVRFVCVFTGLTAVGATVGVWAGNLDVDEVSADPAAGLSLLVRTAVLSALLLLPLGIVVWGATERAYRAHCREP